MSGWIKFWKDMRDDPRVLEAASKLGVKYFLARKTSERGGEDLSPTEALAFAGNAVTGALVRLWGYADEHIRDDDTLPLSVTTLDALVGIEGFFDMIPRDWINKLDDGTVVLPGYCEKNSLIAKRNATVKSNARVAAFRARKKGSGNGGRSKHVTQPTPVTPPVTKMVDQDQDLDFKKKTKTAAAPPSGLDLEAWERWVEYRKGIRKKIGPHSVAEMQQQMLSHGDQQAEAVRHSIANGYVGLYAPKQSPASRPAKPNQDAAWAEANARANALGFRAPHSAETPASYQTAMTNFENNRPKRTVPIVGLGALTAKLTGT